MSGQGKGKAFPKEMTSWPKAASLLNLAAELGENTELIGRCPFPLLDKFSDFVIKKVRAHVKILA